MASFLTRKRLALGAGAVVVVGAATGIGVAAARSSSASLAAQAAASTSSSSSSSSQGPGAPGKPHRGGGAELRLVKVTSVSSTALSGTDAKGHAMTFTIGPSTKVVGADGQSEQATSIPTGELVAVASGGKGAHAPGGGSPSPTAGSGAAAPVAAIKDTGFRAA